MCGEKPHTLCIKFLIKKSFLESNLPQLLPSVSFSMPFAKNSSVGLGPASLGGAALGCATYGRLSVSLEEPKAAGCGAERVAD